jgi:thiamine biosynthesis protein ThiI
MPAAFQPVIVVHYHEVWLKGGNRHFFISKLVAALRQALEGVAQPRFTKPGDRLLIELGPGADLAECVRRVERVFGIANFAIARPVEKSLDAICAAAWDETAPLDFATFAVRAKRSDKSFPLNAAALERHVGGFLLQKLHDAGRAVRVQLNDPAVTCRIEITSGPALVYARKMAGPGGLPPNTAGKMLCLLSGGFDSAVAAWKMMKRGAHLAFAHFYSTGSKPGESSMHVARALVEKLVPWQGSATLHLIPFDPIQREVYARAPEQHRILIYRRLMLRIAERIALRTRARALVTGDSLGQVASQTLPNMAAVGSVARLPLFRPLVGDDKQEILDLARRIGTYDISAEPFHDCCPVFMPAAPALFASAPDLDAAEASLDLDALIRSALASTLRERYEFRAGHVAKVEKAEAVSRQLSANRKA